MSNGSINHKQLTVAVAIIEREGRFLVTRRNDPDFPQWHHCWEFPGGKINAGETPVEALQREIREETALSVHSISLLGVHTQHWNTSQGIQQTFILLYHCHANPGEVVLDPDENDAFEWESSAKILSRDDLLDGNITMFRELFVTPRDLVPA
jgi:mutator protein MutT